MSPRSAHSSRLPSLSADAARFAFVEYEESRDAADAFDRMHDQYVGDNRIGVQWAKRPPARSWRFDGGDERGAPSSDRARSSRRSRSRSRSPYRSRGGDRGSRRGRSRSRSPARDDRYRSNGRGYDDRRGPASSSRRPPSESRSPPRNARRRDESAERPAQRDRSSRRSYSRSPSRSRSPQAKAEAPAMDVDALRPADEPTSAHGDEVADHHDELED
ncbi:hypothetical protein GGI16_006274 [Coemansia sp. S142-1]|nr:hypothetical protein GGI16_006274 [Coemansia sp. S142-1]